MNFLALMLGLAIERLLTHLFHLREFHWLDYLFDAVYQRAAKLQQNIALVVVALLIALLVVPVGFVELFLDDSLAYIPSLVFAVVVLLFCLGPRDLLEEVEEFRAAIESEDQQAIITLAAELQEQAPDDQDLMPDVERAVYAQANNRVFGVVFWFVLLGAAGAWLFRVVDLIRRRAIRLNGPGALAEAPAYVQAAIRIHTVLAWVPARLLMVGYALAGNFDDAVQEWRRYRPPADKVFPRDSDTLLGAIGCGASTKREQGDVSARARIALDLVTRTLWMIWCPALALLTLYDWMV